MICFIGARGRHALVLSLVLLAGIAAGLYAADVLRPSARKMPDMLDLTKIKIDIVDVFYLTRLEGVNGKTYQETEPNEFHGAVVTLRLTKPADMPVTMLAQDLSIHYYHGTTTESAPCQGLSTFSTRPDEDRGMSFYPACWGAQTTKQATTRATTVYIDLFAQFIERDISDLFLAVGQPIGASMITKGW